MPAQPVDDCSLDFVGVDKLLFNTTVDLELSFMVQIPLKAGDTIEVTLPGFMAESKAEVKFEKEVTPDKVDIFAKAWFTEYKPFTNESVSAEVPGCYKTAFNGSL